MPKQQQQQQHKPQLAGGRRIKTGSKVGKNYKVKKKKSVENLRAKKKNRS